MGRMSSEVITLPDGQKLQHTLFCHLTSSTPYSNLSEMFVSSACYAWAFGLCKLFPAEAVICCVRMMSRTTSHSTVTYIRSNSASHHWAFLHVGPSGFVLESRKSGVFSFMTDLPSKQFFFRSLGTKLMYSSFPECLYTDPLQPKGGRLQSGIIVQFCTTRKIQSSLSFR